MARLRGGPDTVRCLCGLWGGRDAVSGIGLGLEGDAVGPAVLSDVIKLLFNSRSGGRGTLAGL